MQRLSQSSFVSGVSQFGCVIWFSREQLSLGLWKQKNTVLVFSLRRRDRTGQARIIQQTRVREDPTSTEERARRLAKQLSRQAHTLSMCCTQWTFQPFSLRWLGIQGSQAIPEQRGRDQLHVFLFGCIGPLHSIRRAGNHHAQTEQSQVLKGARLPAMENELKHRGSAGEDTSQVASHSPSCIHFKSFMISKVGNRMIKGKLESVNRYRCERERLDTCARAAYPSMSPGVSGATPA